MRQPGQEAGVPINKSAPPATTSELRDLGFTKLVRRDDRVYENVTAAAATAATWCEAAGDPADVKKTISD